MTRRSPIARGLLVLLASVGTITFAAGCTNARLGVGLPEAIIYRKVTAPVTLKRPEGERRGEPIEIPRNLVVGRAQAYSLDFSIPTLEFTRILSVGWGDLSIEHALADGNLEEVTYADGEIFSILRVFNRATIIAYGPPKVLEEAAPAE